MPSSRRRRPTPPSSVVASPAVTPGMNNRGRRAPPTPRARLLRRVVTALAAGLAIVVLSRLGVLDRLGGGLAPVGLNWTNDYQLVEYLRGRVVADGLAKTRKECLLFIINGNDPANAVRMRVMEKHSGSCPPAAPGADALPQLFVLLVDRQNHSVQSDAGSPGHFRPLP